jgi:hypothetical protein
MSDIPILGQKPEAQPLVEVCRSFAYKLNLANHGGPAYESADFFASRKIQCAAEDAAWVSQQLFEEWQPAKGSRRGEQRNADCR